MSATIPVYFSPTTKIILDDNSDYTKSLLLKLHGQGFISYADPKAAMQYLLSDYEPKFRRSDLIASDSEILDSSTKHILNISISDLKTKLADGGLSEVSVILVDYHMPEMTGLSFLEEIRHLPMKKVLLTGEKDYRIAVDAFNSGLVDGYIRKDDPGFLDKINEMVAALEWKYFVDASRIVSETPEFRYLNHPAVVALIRELMKKEGLTSYCMTHTQGDFLMQDQAGRQFSLLLRRRSQLSELAKVAEEDGASLETINALNSGLVIPYFNEKEYWEVPGSEWSDWLHAVEKIADVDDLVWAFIGE